MHSYEESANIYVLSGLLVILRGCKSHSGSARLDCVKLLFISVRLFSCRRHCPLYTRGALAYMKMSCVAPSFFLLSRFLRTFQPIPVATHAVRFSVFCPLQEGSTRPPRLADITPATLHPNGGISRLAYHRTIIYYVIHATLLGSVPRPINPDPLSFCLCQPHLHAIRSFLFDPLPTLGSALSITHLYLLITIPQSHPWLATVKSLYTLKTDLQ